jgi:hypothetical protein
VSTAGRNAGAQAGSTAQAVSSAASKAKTPLIAGGAALAGLAGGIAIARNGRRRKVLGVSVPEVRTGRGTKKALDGAAKAFGDAATEFGKAGSRVAELTSEVQRIRERITG